ncbi:MULTISPECIES: ABC transporter ATP-binding protein [unclassified Variovorax]|jgi:branched-chain amino acid transport system ATP-binding protein|uniref:ABC transporter ATP-binding protein n=1 Tax=Variovorax TaxID=34072 RepID=UPI0008E41079|nr:MULTISPECIES: ABC transporter ATP-binding protein [unclassified Variovorax]QRF61670.1 ABC transporter ATP-binding protein [Variovorax paradoxus]TAJ59695.1 MAG: ABC transporter ATP-binding protein [Variovorax sp.]SFP71023.1 amino acid/amide ABC transporter ATP-binding protein 2, HAAT family [Variovorax sp. PDC80]
MSRTDQDTVLEVRGLAVSYAGNRAVALDALRVGRGEILGVIGANGAGKSTLVNALAGWSRGDPRVAGEVVLNGERIDAWPTHDRVRAGLLLVPEGRLVFSRMSVEENLSTAFAPLAAPGRKVYTRDEIYGLFPRLHERRGHLGAQLSGGERQMLGIGRALMMGPRLLLLDEPSIGLAPMLVSQVLQTMRTLARSGLSILLVEQNVRAAMEVVDRLVLLERGRVVLEGPAAEFGNDPRIAQAYLGAHAA